MAANIFWNEGDHSSDRTKQHSADRAIALWKQLIRQYPESTDADRAAFHVAIAYHWSGRLREAERAYEQVLRDYPTTRFTAVIEVKQRKLREELAQTNEGTVRSRPLP